jgi:hypothetical protein
MFDAGNLDTVPTIANATYNAVACKTGYAPSEQATFTYGIVLPPPGFVDSASTTSPEAQGRTTEYYPSTSRALRLPGQPANLAACSFVTRRTAVLPPAAPRQNVHSRYVG